MFCEIVLINFEIVNNILIFNKISNFNNFSKHSYISYLFQMFYVFTKNWKFLKFSLNFIKNILNFPKFN